MLSRHVRPRSLALAALVALTLAPLTAQSPPKFTTPQQQLGHEIGADYVLPTYAQLTEYWKKLDRESDRMTLVGIGKTAEGRDQWLAIITAPENQRKLERYKEISRRLALAEGLDTVLVTCDGRLARALGMARRVELVTLPA